MTGHPSFTLRWRDDGSALVLAGGLRKAGYLRRRADGRWAAHAWPREVISEERQHFDDWEQAAHWIADRFELARPERERITTARQWHALIKARRYEMSDAA